MEIKTDLIIILLVFIVILFALHNVGLFTFNGGQTCGGPSGTCGYPALPVEPNIAWYAYGATGDTLQAIGYSPLNQSILLYTVNYGYNYNGGFYSGPQINVAFPSNYGNATQVNFAANFNNNTIKNLPVGPIKNQMNSTGAITGCYSAYGSGMCATPPYTIVQTDLVSLIKNANPYIQSQVQYTSTTMATSTTSITTTGTSTHATTIYQTTTILGGGGGGLQPSQLAQLLNPIIQAIDNTFNLKIGLLS